jgi:hypothetical protein
METERSSHPALATTDRAVLFWRILEAMHTIREEDRAQEERRRAEVREDMKIRLATLAAIGPILAAVGGILVMLLK